MADVTPPAPILTAHLFPALGAHLIDVLRSLAADDWERPTLAPRWTIPVGWSLVLLAAVIGLFGPIFGMPENVTWLSPVAAAPVPVNDGVDVRGLWWLLGAIAIVLMREADELGLALTVAGLAGGMLVPYARARAEALGLKGEVGFGGRGERVAIIVAGLVLAPWLSLT